ncbi:MAG: ATP-binding protein [Gaiellaceae bacterium]|jgi:hypothetical protein
MTTGQLAQGFDPSAPGPITLGSLRASFALAQGVYTWRRDPSRARFDELEILWPTLHYELRLAGLDNLRLPEFLIGRGCPSFPATGAAFNAFFFDNYAVAGTRSPTLGSVDVRVIDEGARILRVRARPTTLDVWLGGRALKGAVLELNGATYRRRARLVGAGRVSWPLPQGALDDAWLWLKRGSDWLDYRSLGGWGGYHSPDVEIEAPHDPTAEITSLAARGEGQELEYKEKLPDNRGEKRNAFKDVVAFANGGGGVVLFGVDDSGGIVGLAETLVAARHRLTDLLRAYVSPSPPHRLRSLRVDGKRILVLEVDRNDGTLYALTLDANRPEYFVRRAATTYYARPEEIAAVLR